MSRADSHEKTGSKARKQSRKARNAGTAGTWPLLTGKSLYAALCVLLAGATVALYSPVLRYSFVVFDDHEYVTANPHIRQGLSWSTVKWAFTTFTAANWHPLTWLSHALDYQLFALHPAGHHLDSVLMHALNAVVLFLLLVWVTKRVGPSLFVAALFAVHPLNVESVAWVAERKNVLCTLFFFLAMAAYVWYARKPDWRRYILVAALFALGLMAKPMVITLPFVLLLLDYWPLDRMALPPKLSEEPELAPSATDGVRRLPITSLLLEKVPLLVLSAASAWITVRAQREAVGGLQEFPLALRLGNAIVSYGMYLWKMLWPARLAALYPYPGFALPAWQWLLSALVLIVITALVVVYRRKRYLPFGWFWFLGTLIPVIGLVQVGSQAMADRYAYIPLIGIFVMIAWGLDDWARANGFRSVWLIVPALCVLIALALVTHRQMTYWQSEYDLWTHTLAVTERNQVAQGLAAGALVHPEEAMTPHDLETLNTEQKRFSEARWHHQEALKLLRELARRNPNVYRVDVALALMNLGGVDRHLNRLDEARQNYDEAQKIYRELIPHDPDTYLYLFASVQNELGVVDGVQNRLDAQRRHYQEALSAYLQLAQRKTAKPGTYMPALATTLSNLGNLDSRQNRLDEARQHYEEVLKIQSKLTQQDPATYLPEMASTLNDLGHVDRLQNRLDEARQHYEQALNIQSQLAQKNPGKPMPEMAMVLGNLGNLDASQKQMGKARQNFTGALGIYRQLAQQNPGVYLPNMITTLNNVAQLDRLENRKNETRQCYEEILAAYRQLAQLDQRRYMPYVAGTLEQIGSLDKNRGRMEDARAHYQEALAIFQTLYEGDPRFAGDVARVEASLHKLGKKGRSQ